VTDNKPLGMIRIDSKNAERFHLNDFRLLVTITNLSALFLRNAEFFKQTQRLSVTDGLTGLYRPHYLFHEVQKHFESNRPESIPAVGSLLMMDLDHFKRVNDRFGHVVGDNVLIQVARIISRHCPDSGFAVRYGGEEFALFLPGVPGAPAVKLAEKIRHSVADRKIHVRREKIRMTLSIGVASYPGEGEDVKSLIEKADTRLYEAKKKGRNRTVARS
jgi:diguanylate cyclase (GGDEF)-like protein